MADWKHGWIPLTPKAFRQKNHGRTPKPGSKLGRQMDSASRQMDSAIRSRTGRSAPAKKKRQTSGAPSVGDDLDAATAAIRAGDHARAVNLLNRAMRNAKGPTRARIKKQRDELARKIMGR